MMVASYLLDLDKAKVRFLFAWVEIMVELMLVRLDKEEHADRIRSLRYTDIDFVGCGLARSYFVLRSYFYTF